MKRLFAKKTENMTECDAKEFAKQFKSLQENCELMAKKARKIKQLLKNPKNVNEAKTSIKALYNGDNSFIATQITVDGIVFKITKNFKNYLDNTGTTNSDVTNTLSRLQKTKNLFSKIKTTAKKISPTKVATALKEFNSNSNEPTEMENLNQKGKDSDAYEAAEKGGTNPLYESKI